MKCVRAHVLVSGMVQGVGYRESTKNTAKMMKVSGWVRNLESGDVEAVFEGPESNVDKMVEWCKKGSALSKVLEVNVVYEDYVEGLKDFIIR